MQVSLAELVFILNRSASIHDMGFAEEDCPEDAVKIAVDFGSSNVKIVKTLIKWLQTGWCLGFSNISRFSFKTANEMVRFMGLP